MPGCLLDTNILLRLARRGDPVHARVEAAVRRQVQEGAALYYCPQNIVELWSVMTRSTDRNGFGLPADHAEQAVRLIERDLALLPDNSQIHPMWRRLVNDYGVRGRQVHDARLVAAMHVHGVINLLTLNRADFLRYDGINVIDPAEIAGGK